MLRIHSFTAILALQCLYHVSTAFLFAQCNPFKRERIDPLVSYGGESSHMHTFFGSSAISPTANTSAQLREGCSSCSNSLDTSAYWIPTLYYVTNTSRTPVQVGFRAYYQGQSDTTGEFPEDYRIITGSPDTTPADLSAAISSGVNFYCRSGGVQEKKNQYDLITQPCGYMNGNIGFPGSVVYDATLNRYRGCASGDSGCISIPGMFLSVSYSLGPYQFLPGEYLELSTGAGYTYHADFIMGWAKSALDQLSHNTTADLEIGAPDSLQVPAQCVDSPATTSNLTNEDIAAAKNRYQIDGTISGSYGFDLTITDGLTINDGTFVGISQNTSEVSSHASNTSAPNSSYTYSLSPSVSTTSSARQSQGSAVEATLTASSSARSPASFTESKSLADSSSSTWSPASAVEATLTASSPARSPASFTESKSLADSSSSTWSPASAVEATLTASSARSPTSFTESESLRPFSSSSSTWSPASDVEATLTASSPAWSPASSVESMPLASSLSPWSSASDVEATLTSSVARNPASFTESQSLRASPSSTWSPASAVEATLTASSSAWSPASAIESKPLASSLSPLSPASAVEATPKIPITILTRSTTLTITTTVTMTFSVDPADATHTGDHGLLSPCLPRSKESDRW